MNKRLKLLGFLAKALSRDISKYAVLETRWDGDDGVFAHINGHPTPVGFWLMATEALNNQQAKEAKRGKN